MRRHIFYLKCTYSRHQIRRFSTHPMISLTNDSDDLVLQHSQLKARPPVAEKDVSSLENWFYNNGNAILENETEYIKRSSDLFSVVPKSKSPLRVLLEHSHRFRLLKLWQEKYVDAAGYSDENVHYFSDEKIDRFIATFIMVLGIIMLIAPLWILAFLGGLVQRLGVISAFIVLFVALISVTTVAKPFESLAAAAAWVFLVAWSARNISPEVCN